MSTVSEIIEAVKKLPERDKSEFLERLGEVDFDDAWDRRLRPTRRRGGSIGSRKRRFASIAKGNRSPSHEEPRRRALLAPVRWTTGRNPTRRRQAVRTLAQQPRHRSLRFKQVRPNLWSA